MRDVNASVHEAELQLLRANGGRFEINQLLFPDETELDFFTMDCA